MDGGVGGVKGTNVDILENVAYLVWFAPKLVLGIST